MKVTVLNPYRPAKPACCESVELNFRCIICEFTRVECCDEICEHCRENEIDYEPEAAA